MIDKERSLHKGHEEQESRGQKGCEEQESKGPHNRK